MKVTNIHEAKTHFSKLVERAAAGEEIVIGKAGKPVARLGAVRGSRARRNASLAVVEGQDLDPSRLRRNEITEIEKLFSGELD